MTFAYVDLGADGIFGVPLYMPPPHNEQELAQVKSAGLNLGRTIEAQGKIHLPRLILSNQLDLDSYLKQTIRNATGYSPFGKEPYFKRLFPNEKGSYRYNFVRGIPTASSMHEVNDHVLIKFYPENELRYGGGKKQSCLIIRCAVPGITHNEQLQNRVSETIHEALDWATHAPRRAMVSHIPGVEDYLKEFLGRLRKGASSEDYSSYAISLRNGIDTMEVALQHPEPDGTIATVKCIIKGLRRNNELQADIKTRVAEVMDELNIPLLGRNSAHLRDHDTSRYSGR